jgi:lipoprotein NlpI
VNGGDVVRILLTSVIGLAALVGAVSAKGATAADYYRRSLHADTLAARFELLDRALRANPNHIPSLVLRAELNARLGKDKAALDDGARAADLAPTDAGLNAAAAALAEKVNDYSRAVLFYNRALARDNLSIVLRARQIEALVRLPRPDEAIQSATLLVRSRPDLDYPYAIRAGAYESGDRFAEALEDIQVLVARYPQEARYYLQRCTLYRGLGEGRKALADADRAVRLRPEDSYAHAARGCSFEVLGDYENAIAAYKRAVELSDDARFQNIWICLALRRLGRREEADRFIREVRKELKSEAWVAPVIRYLAGEIKEEDVFESARHADPQTQREQLCEAYYYVGAAHMTDKNYDRAEALFKKCIDLRVHMFYEHGFALRDLGKLKALREQADEKPADAKTEP